MRVIHLKSEIILFAIFIGAFIILICLLSIRFSTNSTNSTNTVDNFARRSINFFETGLIVDAERSNFANDVVKELIVTAAIDGSFDLSDVSTYDVFVGDTIENRRKFIKSMAIHAWNGYKRYAWGANEVRPISKSPYNSQIFGGSESVLAATIFDSVDTFWIMNLTQQYNEAKEYIQNKFDINKVAGSISVFEANIRHVGGMLSAFALTKDKLFKERAEQFGRMLLRAFPIRLGIPKSLLNPITGETTNYVWSFGGSSILAEIGSFSLEFNYLSAITNDEIYRQTVHKILNHLNNITCDNHLYYNFISPDTGEWTMKHASLGAMGDSFYEYLIKEYIQRYTTDLLSWKMYEETIEAIKQKMVRRSKEGLVYVAELSNEQVLYKMSHLSCFAVGMFALEAHLTKNESTQRLAEELGNTCHESYARSATGLGPEMFYFEEEKEAIANTGEAGYILRPEVIEGWFYLWRFTKKPIYKEWIWSAIQSIEKFCKKEAGYTGIRNVYNINEGFDDVQQSFFLAETLKYAYLSFCDESVISLNEWVFNTEGHPLPILKR